MGLGLIRPTSRAHRMDCCPFPWGFVLFPKERALLGVNLTANVFSERRWAEIGLVYAWQRCLREVWQEPRPQEVGAEGSRELYLT